jgi:NAD(P)-dependent dehydrogenase (short-subunit alcohol dehydrogenase family)
LIDIVTLCKSKEKELHVLFNSGGVMFPPIETMTVDGYDLQFGTNVLGLSLTFLAIQISRLCFTGHFYLTQLLLPTLLATASSSPDKTARVINTSSMGHLSASKIDYDTIKEGPKRTKKGSMALYCQSKFVGGIFACIYR